MNVNDLWCTFIEWEWNFLRSRGLPHSWFYWLFLYKQIRNNRMYNFNKFVYVIMYISSSTRVFYTKLISYTYSYITQRSKKIDHPNHNRNKSESRLSNSKKMDQKRNKMVPKRNKQNFQFYSHEQKIFPLRHFKFAQRITESRYIAHLILFVYRQFCTVLTKIDGGNKIFSNTRTRH